MQRSHPQHHQQLRFQLQPGLLFRNSMYCGSGLPPPFASPRPPRAPVLKCLRPLCFSIPRCNQRYVVLVYAPAVHVWRVAGGSAGAACATQG